MKKKWLLLLLIPVIIIVVIVIIFLIERSKVEFHDDEIGIIGGADGPTVVFLAGNIGGASPQNTMAENTEPENTKAENTEIIEQENSIMQIEIQIGGTTMVAELESNSATEELVEILEDDELIMNASNYGGFEKVCRIGQSLSNEDEQIVTKPGDIMLYNGNQLVIFYDSNSWAYTPIGHINASAEELEGFLSGDEDEVIIRLVE